MAIIQRPAKQGGATTYQGKVALGYVDILANEVDADLDTIYSAWNSGADAVNLRPNSITADKIAPNQIGPRELVDDLPGAILAIGAVGTRELADGAVTQGKLAADAVTSDKIAAGAINTADLAAQAVTWDKIALNQINTDHLVDNAVTWNKIALNQINTNHLVDGAVTGAKIADGTITTADLAPGAISAGQIADGAVTTAKLAPEAVGTLQLYPGATVPISQYVSRTDLAMVTDTWQVSVLTWQATITRPSAPVWLRIAAYGWTLNPGGTTKWLNFHIYVNGALWATRRVGRSGDDVQNLAVEMSFLGTWGAATHTVRLDVLSEGAVSQFDFVEGQIVVFA